MADKDSAKLRANAEDQVTRLMTQLSDLEEMKEDLDEDEYTETKADTLQQLEEFQASLKKMTTGDMTLQDDLGAMKLAIQAAISQAFKTPEVIKMFALKQPKELRAKLTALQEEQAAGSVSETVFNQQTIEILTALKKLGQTLSDSELSFLKGHMTADLQAFESVKEDQAVVLPPC